MTSSDERLKHKCVDLNGYNRYLNQIWYRAQIPHYQHTSFAIKWFWFTHYVKSSKSHENWFEIKIKIACYRMISNQNQKSKKNDFKSWFQIIWFQILPNTAHDVSCTLCPRKVYPLMFDNNFGKYGPIFKLLSPGDLEENSLCTHAKISTSPAICCYTTLWNSKIQKSNRIFTWTWRLICLTKICCEILRTCHKYIALMILLKYVYNTWSIA